MANHPIIHVDFSAENLAGAAQFYKELFGWQITAYPEMNYYTFTSEGGPGGGFNEVGSQIGGTVEVPPGHVLIYVATDDVDKTLAKAEQMGGKTLLPKTEIQGMGWYAVFTDPTGNQIGLLDMSQQSVA